MKQYLAVDSGGSKVLALLYDEQFRPIRFCRVGSMRDNTTSPTLIRHSIASLIDEMALAGAHLDLITGIPDNRLLAQLRTAGTVVDQVVGCGELEAGFAAAEMFGDGLLALAGTGASLFGRYGGHTYAIGGYGASVSDEGSGYWIAREAFGAAIRYDEDRGSETILKKLLAEQLGRPNDLRAGIFHIYAQTALSPVAAVASCAPVVSLAAESGDAVAIEILRHAGQVLAEQLIALVRRHGLPKDLPVTISGSVWRSHPTLMREFRQVLQKAGMCHDVVVPAFEPVVGMVIQHYHRLYGTFTPKEHDRFAAYYRDFTFSIPQ